MGNLLQKLGLKDIKPIIRKPILKETTLIDNDLVYFHSAHDSLDLIKNGDVYSTKKTFSEINHLDPKVSLEYHGPCTKRSLKVFQTYKKLKKIREL